MRRHAILVVLVIIAPVVPVVAVGLGLDPFPGLVSVYIGLEVGLSRREVVDGPLVSARIISIWA